MLSVSPIIISIHHPIPTYGPDFPFSWQNSLEHVADTKVEMVLRIASHSTYLSWGSPLVNIDHPNPNEGHDFKFSSPNPPSPQTNLKIGSIWTFAVCLRYVVYRVNVSLLFFENLNS